MKQTVYLFLAILFFACQAKKKVEQTPFQDLTERVDHYANQIIQKGNINSLAVAIYKDGEMYHGYYGSMTKGENTPPNDSTLYEIASITKVFVGSLAAKAVLEEKITLEDDIRTYLDGEYPNLEFEGTPITVRNLLTHTLGLKDKRTQKSQAIRDSIAQGYFKDAPIPYTMNDFLEDLKTMEVDKKPGTVFVYNSMGSELMSHILERVYQDSFNNLLTAFLKELEMNNTFLEKTQLKRNPNCIIGYGEDGKPAPRDRSPLLGGGGGLVSTLPDLMKFIQFQLESTNPIIKESTKILYEDEEETMGYLWQNMGVAEREGFYYGKTGTSFGMQSSLLLCPDSNYGKIIILNNTSDAAIDDWAHLYNVVETDLIMFPKINLLRHLKDDFIANIEKGKERFVTLAKEEEKYHNTNLNFTLNALAYELMYVDEKPQKAIEMLQYAIQEFPEDGNLHDSLGEA
ncbi:MAG: serine hydrolase domain-containing protein, partial [Bacteroidota bacterium]